MPRARAKVPVDRASGQRSSRENIRVGKLMPMNRAGKVKKNEFAGKSTGESSGKCAGKNDRKSA